MNIQHFAASAITVKDFVQNLTQIRLFTHTLVAEPLGEQIKLHDGGIETAGSAIFDFAWTVDKGWSSPNDGAPIVYSHCAVPFDKLRGGAVHVMHEGMTLIYWDRPGIKVADPKESKPFQSVARWTAAGGWKIIGEMMICLF